LLIFLEILLFFVVTQLKLGALNMERWSTLTFVRSRYIPRKQIQYSRYCCNSAITLPSGLQDSFPWCEGPVRNIMHDQFPIGIDDLKAKISKSFMQITPEL
jgi:hypothetical protein